LVAVAHKLLARIFVVLKEDDHTKSVTSEERKPEAQRTFHVATT
jgi:hypothetical protein